MIYSEFLEKILPQILQTKSFAGKIKIADQNLTRIGSGSGRIVYDINDERVLKLARNPKGVAQNEEESNIGQDYYTESIVTKVYEHADDDSWIIAEKAKKVTERRIKELTGIPGLTHLFFYLRNSENENKGGKKMYGLKPEVEESLIENEFAVDLFDLMMNYNVTAGDLGRPSSYGEVLRNGQPTIVLTDYGLSDEVYNTHYAPKRNQQFRMYEMFNFDGNDDILSDIGNTDEVRHGMWALMPYGVGDGDGVVNENILSYVQNINEYSTKRSSNFPVLTDVVHECVNNLKEVLNKVQNKKQFYTNLVELQDYLISQGLYDREPISLQEYDIPAVEYDSLNDKAYATQLSNAVAQKLGLPTPRFVGGGANGFAFELDNTRIMKITSDIGEADAAFKIFRERVKYVASVYNLYKVVDTEQNRAYFVIIQENVKDKPLEKFRKFEADIEKISPMGMLLPDYFSKMRKRNTFNYNEMLELAKQILTDNPEAGVSEADRKAAYEYVVGLINIRNELLQLDIKSTDYTEIANLGYSNGVLKFFDVGGYMSPEPQLDSKSIVYLPEDGTSKFTTDNSIGGDDFPVYNQNDSTPLTDNNVPANNFMYENEKLKQLSTDKFGDTEYRMSVKDDVFVHFAPKKIAHQIAKTKTLDPNFSDTFVDAVFAISLTYGIFYPKVQIHNIGGDRSGDWNDYVGIVFKTNDVPKIGRIEEVTWNGIVHLNSVKFLSVESVINLLKNTPYKIKENDYVIYNAVNEDLEYHHAGDATKDEFVVDEGRKKEWMPGAQAVTVKKKCQLGGLGSTSTACNQGDIKNLEIKKIVEDVMHDFVNDLTEGLDYNELNRGVPKDEPIHVSDFPLSDLTVSKRGIFGAIQDIKQGRPSQTNEPVFVFYNIKDKIFLVEDGYHRVAQAYLNKEKTISVNIYSDVWSDYVANVSSENKFNLTEAKLMSLQDLPFKADIESLGGKIYSVGGAVRDEFLGKESKDLDILITGIAMDKLEQVLSNYGRVDAVGKSFGILKFKPKGAVEDIDVAIPRTEKPTGAGGHKGFEVTSDHALPIEKDLERRDFTINAIAKDTEGNIVDPYGGRKDLQNKTIRVVNPNAFSDDPLRMLRAVQFASRFGFEIEPKTMKMIQDNAGRIREIPPERILTEFEKIVTKGNKLTGAYLLKQTGLLKNIFGKDMGLLMGQNIWENTKTMGEFIWLLSHNLVPNAAEFYKNNLKGDIDTYKEIRALQMAFDSGEATNMIEARAVASNMYALSPRSLQSQIIPNVIKIAVQELLTGKYPKGLGELAVNGNDLMQIGLQGKAVGDMLKSMLLKVYSGKVRNNRQDLLALTGQNNNMIKEELNNRIEYGCLMLFLDVPVWEKITSVIKPEDVYEKDNDYGIEKEPHLTILYGFHDEVTSTEVFELFKEVMPMKPIEVKISGISVFENENFDVVKFDVNSPELTELNEIMRQLPNTTKFPNYHAHITIAYVKKGEGEKYVRPFEKERKLLGNKLVYTWKGHRGSDGESMMLNESVSSDTWEVNDENVDINFFVKKYDEWNTQGGKPSYADPSKASVLEFFQNNYEDFSNDENLKNSLYQALTDREVLNENKTKSHYQQTKESLMRSKSIGKEMKEEILKYLAGGSTYHGGGSVRGLSIPKVEGKSFNGVSMGADKDGFFVYTHRARSKSHVSPDKIPVKEIKFIETTG